jgi:hypothetical protein
MCTGARATTGEWKKEQKQKKVQLGAISEQGAILIGVIALTGTENI